MEWCTYCRKHVAVERICRNPDMRVDCHHLMGPKATEHDNSAFRVYFAHPMVDYDTPREAAAHEALHMHFGPEFTIVNPNRPEYQQGYEDAGKDFKYWTTLARSCRQVAFMAMPGGHWIGSGVWKEVDASLVKGSPVWEISREKPYGLERVIRLDPERLLTVEETRRWTRIMEAYRNGR
jgi:hypothetical protein